MSMKMNLVAVAALLGLGISNLASAAGSNESTNLANGLRQAKAKIDQVIAAGGGRAGVPVGGGPIGGGPIGGGPIGGGPIGGGSGPWLTADEGAVGDLVESDALSLPILIQASASLSQAASFADQATLAYLGANIAFGNFRFAESCNQMGLSRSQIARANQAALMPPAGFLAAFGTDLTNTVIELNTLRATVGCP